MTPQVKGDYNDKMAFAANKDCPCRPCFHIHDFQYINSQGHVVHDYKCQQNANHGCPYPTPEAVHDFGKRRKTCSRCGVLK